jgi:hypothetical protein
MALKRLLATTILAAGLVATPYLAQNVQAQETGTAEHGAELMQDMTKIDAFIMAALAVAETRQAYLAQLDATADEQEQMAIIAEADAAILSMVEATPDITVEEYIAIGEAAAADPELAAMIDARFTEAHGG